MKPKLRFSEFNDNWQNKRISEANIEVIDGDRGNNYPNGEELLNDGHCLFLSAKNVTKSGFCFDDRVFISQEKDQKLRNGKLNRFDIVLTTRGTVGNISYYDEQIQYDNIRINSGMVILRSNKSDFLPKYLYKATSSKMFVKQVNNISFGSAQPQLTVSGINKIKLSIPSKSEQQKIADFLTVVDDKISAIDKKVELLKEYKNGVMQKIFGQEIRFKDEDGNGFAVWENREINEISSDYDNKRKPISSEKRISGNFPYYGANGIVDYVRDYIFDGEYILVAEDGVVDITKYPIHLAKGKFWANNHCHILQGKNINNIFLYYALQNTKFSRYITGSAQTKLNNQVLGKITLNIPVKNEQQKIADFLTKLDDKINLTEQKLNQAKQFKKALLQRMFV